MMGFDMYDLRADDEGDVDDGSGVNVGVGVNRLRHRHKSTAGYNSPYFEVQNLNKVVPEKIDYYLKQRYVNMPLIEFRKQKEEINNYIRTILEREMGRYENSHTADWLIKIETIQNEQHVFLVSEISANLKFT